MASDWSEPGFSTRNNFLKRYQQTRCSDWTAGFFVCCRQAGGDARNSSLPKSLAKMFTRAWMEISAFSPNLVMSQVVAHIFSEIMESASNPSIPTHYFTNGKRNLIVAGGDSKKICIA